MLSLPRRLVNLVVLTALSLLAAGAGYGQAVVEFDKDEPKIEKTLLRTLDVTNAGNFYVHFYQKPDLSSAYGMTWEERGHFVVEKLRQNAATSQAEVQKILDQAGLRYHTFISTNSLYVERGDRVTALALADLPQVSAITAPRSYQIVPPIIDDSAAARALAGTLAWGLQDTEANQFWPLYGEGGGIVVATIDSGVQWNHPALDQAYRCGTNPADPTCWHDPSNICGAAGACDNNGHGTHVTGTMVGDNDPFLTYQVGMAPASQWIACKGCESNSCSDFALNACADWILAPGGDPNKRPHVVNNSWGGGPGETWFSSKVDAWRAAGIFPTFAAGNAGPNCDTLGSPGDYQTSFASAAHDSTGTIASFSSRGPSRFGDSPHTKPNISAPGVNICSALPGNSWSCGYSGTSMASPHTAGAVALLWSCNPALRGQIDLTFQILQETAGAAPAGSCGVPASGQGNYTYGYGYLNVLRAGADYCGLDLPELVVDPEALAVSLPIGQTQILPLRLSNAGGLNLDFQIFKSSSLDPSAINLPSAVGYQPKSAEPLSAQRVPRDSANRRSLVAASAESPLGPLSGAPAYAMEIYPNANLVYLPDADAPGTWTSIANKAGTTYFAGDFTNDDFSRLYVLDASLNQLHALNPQTGATQIIGSSVPRAEESWTGMTGGRNGVMYAASSYCGSRSTLYTLNLNTGAATEISAITNAPCIIDIAIAPDLTLYGIDIVNDVLVRIDRATGAGTVVGNLGYSANYAQGMDFEEVSDILYWAAEDGAGGEMRVIDTTTGNSAFVGDFPSGAEVDALAFATVGPSDIPWLSVNPASGTVAGETDQYVNVTFDASVTGVSPGVYEASLRIVNNSLVGTRSVPVRMEVVSEGCEESLHLQNRTVSGTEVHIACLISAGPAFRVMVNGDATLQAGQRVTLFPGFSVAAGGRFRAFIDTSLPFTQVVDVDPGDQDISQVQAPNQSTIPVGSVLIPPTLLEGFWPQATPLLWSELPQGLRAILLEHNARIRDAQQSADGTIIVFATAAALAWPDVNEHSDVYYYDVMGDDLRLVSQTHQGLAADGPSHSPRLDGEGRFLVFLSAARNLIEQPGNEFTQLYHHDLIMGATLRLSQTDRGIPASGDMDQPLLAGDWVIYRGQAFDLSPAGPGIYRQNLIDGRRQPVGFDDRGRLDPLASRPAADGVGEEIAYQRPDSDKREQIYLNDTQQVQRLSLQEDPILGLLDHCCAALSNEGRYLAYRELDKQDGLWLHLLDRDLNRFARQPWPTAEALREQPPRFSHDGSELWWIAPEQGPGLPELMHRMANPFFMPDRR